MDDGNPNDADPNDGSDGSEDWPDDDRALLDELAEALGPDPAPAGLVAASYGLLSWIDVDHDLAELLDAGAAEPAGTRGDGRVDVLRFDVAGGSIIVELILGRSEIRGHVLPAGPTLATFETLDARPDIEVSLDDLGRFSLGDVPSGPVRLRLTGGPGRPVLTDWFVL